MHFSVLVIGEDPYVTLEPFREREEDPWLGSKKWDWCSMGGHWEGGFFVLLVGKESDSARMNEIDWGATKNKHGGSYRTFAVARDMKWYEKGPVIGGVKKSDDVWEKEYQEILDSIPNDAKLSIFDCHV